MNDNKIYMILHHVIAICDWCRFEDITCQECRKLHGACKRNMAILDLAKYFK